MIPFTSTARTALAATAFLTFAAGAALAQDTSPPATGTAGTTSNVNRGFYIGGGAGVNLQADNDFRHLGGESKAKYDPGFVGLLNFGYALGNGLRFEFEPSYRENGVDTVGGLSGDGDTKIAAAMVNAIYDFDFRTPVVPLIPHIGAGIGYAYAWNKSTPHNGGQTVKGSDGNLAYQAIAGVEYPLVPSLKVGLDYRYFVAHNLDFRAEPSGVKSHMGDFEDHSVLLTLRYEFGVQRPAVVPAAAPAAAPVAPPPPAPRNFIVYFDWNRADLTGSAVPIVDEAANYAKQGRTTRINVTGHADRSGSPAYNQRLSERRAATIRNELIRRGIPADEIVTVGRGEDEPAVPTPDGVREPRNRRVEIVLQAPGA